MFIESYSKMVADFHSKVASLQQLKKKKKVFKVEITSGKQLNILKSFDI